MVQIILKTAKTIKIKFKDGSLLNKVLLASAVISAVISVVAGVLAVVGLLVFLCFVTFYNPQVAVAQAKHVLLKSGLNSALNPESGAKTGRILFLGDTSTGDMPEVLLKKHGWGFQFKKTSQWLGLYNGVVANFESPITLSKSRWPIKKRWVYKANPQIARALKKAGIDAVTLANNHIFDYGAQGLRDTVYNLNKAGVFYLGAGMSEAEARRGLVFETPGGNLGMLSYMQDKYRWRIRDGAFAQDTLFGQVSGAAKLVYADLKDDISRIKKQSDVVVVIVHFGENYKPVTRRQQAIARACIDFGADIVIGHHSHQGQPVQIYKGRPIVYSLGNYAFGTPGHSSMMFGMAAAVYLQNKKLAQMEFIPLVTQNRIVKYQPVIPRKKRLDDFYKYFLAESEKLGTAIKRKGSSGFVVFK